MSISKIQWFVGIGPVFVELKNAAHWAQKYTQKLIANIYLDYPFLLMTDKEKSGGTKIPFMAVAF
jgi:hypothetical protein